MISKSDLFNIVLGVYIVAVVLFGIANVFGLRTLLSLLVLAAAAILTKQLLRVVRLRTRGYCSGRRKGAFWIYEEREASKVRSLRLPIEHTEPGHYELFVPTDREWRKQVPEWAQDRRDEIARRISEGWREDDFHFERDCQDA